MMLGDTNNRFSASKAVVVLASGLLVGLFLVALLSQMLARIDALDALTQMRLATTLQNLIMFMLPAVAVGTLCGGGNPLRFLRLDKAPSAMAVAGIVLISLAMTPAMNWLVAWNASLSLPEAMKPVEQWMRAQENAAQEATDTLLSGSSVWDLIASVVCVGLLTGLGEEMFFRGALQRICCDGMRPRHLAVWTAAFFSTFPFQFFGFVSRLVLGAFFGYDGMRRRHLAVWTAAFVFSTLHFQFFGFVPRLVLGAFFGYAYLWSGSLWVPVIGHALNNSAVVAFMWMGNNSIDAAAMDEAGSQSAVVAIVSAAVTVAMMVAYKKILANGKKTH